MNDFCSFIDILNYCKYIKEIIKITINFRIFLLIFFYYFQKDVHNKRSKDDFLSFDEATSQNAQLSI